MKIRLFEIEPGRWIVNTPSKKYQDKVESCPIPLNCQNKRMLTVESPFESMPYECVSQIVVDEDDNISLDVGWSDNLMSPMLQFNRLLKKIKEKIKVEAEKETPDLVSVFKAQQELSNLAELQAKPDFDIFNCKEIYEKSLKQLQDDPEADKPVIEQKLQAKITELEAKEEPVGEVIK